MPLLFAAAAAALIACAYGASWVLEIIASKRRSTRIDETGDL